MEGIGHTRDQARRTTDEYKNPIHAGDMGGDYSSNGTGTGVTTVHGTTPVGGGGYGHEGQQQHYGGADGGGTGKLHRSGSSSSSSSEDDGVGGRRKKGIKDKIKDKLPGGNKDEQTTETTTHEATYGFEGEQWNEKKGMMDKIKDILPGGHRD